MFHWEMPQPMSHVSLGDAITVEEGFSIGATIFTIQQLESLLVNAKQLKEQRYTQSW